ncbi:MAG: hypothetical protein M3461_19345 [Pseudomonadota bacterium]|nr:hypothetical protein [Pseudomonadota bacterium]
MTPGQDLATRADIAELKAELEADIAWIKWIVTGGVVGLYVLRSIVEWMR